MDRRDPDGNHEVCEKKAPPPYGHFLNLILWSACQVTDTDCSDGIDSNNFSAYNADMDHAVDGNGGSYSDFHKFCPDSGAYKHFINNINLFHTIHTKAPNIRARVANGEHIRILAVGDVDIPMFDADGNRHVLQLKNALYAPNFTTNLISIRCLWKDSRIKTRFGERDFFKTKDGVRLYFSHTPPDYNLAYHTTHGLSRTTIHKRYGHCGARRLELAANRSTGAEFLKGYKFDEACDSCEQAGNTIRTTSQRPKQQESNRANRADSTAAQPSEPQRTGTEEQAGGETYINTRRAHFPSNKARRAHFPSNAKDRRRSTNEFLHFGQRVSSDLCGPFPLSREGFLYAINFVDNFTGFTHVEYLKSKGADEVLQALKRYERIHAKWLPGGHVEEWHCDRGGEFTSGSLNDFCDELAIKRSFSVPYVSNSNAKAERFWGLVLRPMRAMFADSKLPHALWPDAMRHACRLHNCLPTTSNRENASPFECVFGRLPDLSRVRTFGCTVWYRVPQRDLTNKCSPRFIKAIHLGFDPVGEGYRVFVPELKRFTCVPTKARFNEEQFISPGSLVGTHESFVGDEDDDAYVRTRAVAQDQTAAQHRPDAGANPTVGDRPVQPARTGRFADRRPGRCAHTNCTLDAHGDDVPHSFEQPTHDTGLPSDGVRRNPRKREPPKQFIPGTNDTSVAFVYDGYWARRPMACFVDANVHKTPDSYNEAISGPFAERWKTSMDVEIAGLLKHQTWEAVSRKTIPAGRRPTKSKFVYKIKYNRDGTIDKWKSRFVVCGYSQQKGLDYDQSFSSTLRASSFRLLLALASIHKLRLDHMDVSNAFTQANIDDVDIWVEPAKGYEQYDADGRSLVYKLKKALYGSKQSGRLWQLTLRKFLISNEMGFTCSLLDPCLFVRRRGNETILIGVYVDDLVVASNSDRGFQEFKCAFCNHFNAKHEGRLNWFLGMGIDQDASFKTSLNQTKYIEDLVSKFIPDTSTLVINRPTPAPADKFHNVGLATTDQERARMATRPYLQLIGSLLYLSTMSRPDISYYMSVLCRVMSDPSEEAYEQALGVLRYLHHTRHHKISYSSDFSVPESLWKYRNTIKSNMGFHAYSDASWNVPNPAYGFVLFLAGGPISYASKNLKSADSSCEAEYTAASKAARDIIYIRSICMDLGFPINGITVLGVDNTAAIDITRNFGITQRNKHLCS